MPKESAMSKMNHRLWVDKHQPQTFNELSFNAAVGGQLHSMTTQGSFPHLLVHGPTGAGKRTLVRALLADVFSPSASMIEQTRVVARTIDVPGSTAVDLLLNKSPYHIELSPADVGPFRDRHVVQVLLKEIAQTPPVAKTGRPYNVVVVTEADLLSSDAQAALRRTMEKYMRTCRIVLVCESTSKIIAPLQSRCALVRVPAPTEAEMCEVLQSVVRKERAELVPGLAKKIALGADRNMRRALVLLERIAMGPGGAQALKDVSTPQPRENWALVLDAIANMARKEPTPRGVIACRTLLFDLLTSNVPGPTILEGLMDRFLAAEEGAKSMERRQLLVDAAAHFESAMSTGSKDIFHLEAFLLQALAIFQPM